MASKAKSQRIHAKRMAKMRYEIDFNNGLREQFIKMIQSGQAVFLYATSNRARTFAVKYNDRLIPVVYDNQRKEIVTLLPPEALNDYQKKLEDKF
ncbi:MAG: hypothetical protein V1889_01600 [archaeon]